MQFSKRDGRGVQVRLNRTRLVKRRDGIQKFLDSALLSVALPN
jgi:hypothetical protein